MTDYAETLEEYVNRIGDALGVTRKREPEIEIKPGMRLQWRDDGYTDSTIYTVDRVTDTHAYLRPGEKVTHFDCELLQDIRRHAIWLKPLPTDQELRDAVEAYYRERVESRSHMPDYGPRPKNAPYTTLFDMGQILAGDA